MKAIVIGQRTGELPDPDIKVVKTDDVVFGTDLFDCRIQIGQIVNCACRDGLDAVIFNDPPSIVTVALVKIGKDTADISAAKGIKIGVVIRSTDPRIDRREKRLYLGDSDWNYSMVRDAVKHANPDASVRFVHEAEFACYAVVTAEQPKLFSHIEWL